MARRSRRPARDAEEDYLPEEREDDDFDEEEEERPRGRRARRSRDEDDDEDEEPRRRRRPARDEDEDEDDDEEEEERPRRSSRGKSKPKGRARRSRDEDEDEDEDDEPAPRRKKSTQSAGWGGYKKTKEKTSNFTNKWKVTPGDEVLVKFLADEPFGSYAIHWFEELGKGQKKGWMCLEPIEDRCPACDIGDRPKGKALFSIVAFDDDGNPSVEVLEAGTWLADQLENLAASKNGPLSKHYWALSATGGGKKGPVNYSLSVVKERDEEEWDEWGFNPLSEDELEEFAEVEHKLEDVEQIPSYKDFKALVRSLDD